MPVLSTLLALPLAAGLASSPAPTTPESDRLTGAAFAHATANIPAFARKYGMSCSVCHAPAPRLTAFGEAFAGNGFELAPGEAPRDTIDTADPLLRLQRDIPLAIRFDAYVRALTRRNVGEVAYDVQTPWLVKLLSGGQISDKVSYYLYFFLGERGEVAGLEDAYVQFTDIGGSGVSTIIGQFQVSDPLFKRELRLPYEDYQAYRVRVGDAATDLTYDRGVMASWSPWEGGDVVAQIVNGQGLREANEARTYDRDPLKSFALRVSQDVGPLRLGAFAFSGGERADGVTNDTWIWGPDATLAVGNVAELNLQYLQRTDDDAFFGRCSIVDPCPGGITSPTETTVDAVMAELIWSPQGPAGRLFITGLYNWVDADQPVVSLRVGEQLSGEGFVSRYSTGTVGAHYLLARNLRVMAEAGWDFEGDQARLVTGFMTAF